MNAKVVEEFSETSLQFRVVIGHSLVENYDPLFEGIVDTLPKTIIANSLFTLINFGQVSTTHKNSSSHFCKYAVTIICL